MVQNIENTQNYLIESLEEAKGFAKELKKNNLEDAIDKIISDLKEDFKFF